mgnify:CR=1 FL=1
MHSFDDKLKINNYLRPTDTSDQDNEFNSNEVHKFIQIEICVIDNGVGISKSGLK